MTMQLFIKYESTTLDLQEDGYKLIDGFFPETPDEGAESVSDQFTILIKGSSADDLRAKIGAITLMLEHSRRHVDDSLAAWIYFSVDDPYDPGGTIPEWQSKIVDGLVMYDKNLDRNWRQNKVLLTVVIEHKPYWDSSIEYAVPLTNGNGSRVTSGLTIYNHDDGGTSPAHDNWVQIDAADILGDMPGRTRLEVLNSYATNRLYTLWIGQNWTDPDNFSPILEGESSSLGTQYADSACSNGYYMQKSLISGSEQDIYKWTLSAAYLNACKGGYFKILARWWGAPRTEVKYRLKLEFAVTHIWQTGQITLDTSRGLQIRDMFTLRIPPWLLGETSLASLDLILSGEQNTGSSFNINLDFLQVTPLDGWRLLECSGYGVLQNSRMVDDGLNDVCYIDTGAGSDKAGYLVPYGSPIELYPAKKQKLHFLMHSQLGDIAEIVRTASVKLFYRPRRRTI